MHILDTTDWYLDLVSITYFVYIVHTVHVYIYAFIYIYINSRYTYSVYCCRYSIYHIYYVKFIQRTYLPIL